MNCRVIEKLRSRTGASITFGLLIFLVCAVLGSVLLTAGTAASGRMSRIVETDQKYYAVTSAAELLKDLIDGKSVSIVTVTERQYTTVYTGGSAGNPTPGEPSTTVYIVPDKKGGEVSEEWDLIAQNQVSASFTADSIPEDAAKRVHDGSTLTGRTLTLTSTASAAAGLDYDVLAVTVSEDLAANGNMTLTLYNTYKKKNEPSDPGSRYSLVMSFGADPSVTTRNKSETLSSTAISETSYSVETKSTEINITTLTWNLTGIKVDA